jgi:hypothetical protein
MIKPTKVNSLIIVTVEVNNNYLQFKPISKLLN